ncbi:MAG: hypothetical protein CL946_13860 [Ectothiorhodospiraceae bacterium]|nr:hypothetical protein [Ectothiorhodospiraceae bacterium]
MLNLMKEGYDAPAKMWAITARWNSFQEDRGTPDEYGKFINNLGNNLGKRGKTDIVVRSFVHYTRKKELLYAIDQKLNDKMKEVLLHVLTVQYNSAARAFREHAIKAVSEKLITETGKKVIDPKSVMFYIELTDFGIKASEGGKGSAAVSFMRVMDKAEKNDKAVAGSKIMRELLFFVPTLYDLSILFTERSMINRSFPEELTRDYYDSRAAYEQALVNLSLLRMLMRDSLAEWKEMVKRHDGLSYTQWPEPDLSRAIELVGGVSRNQSLFALYLKDHEIYLNEVYETKDAFALTWYLLGYPENTAPPMEVIY